MPRTVVSAAAQFGFIGVAFALLSFLFFAAFVIVVAAALGSVLVERSEPDDLEPSGPALRTPRPSRAIPTHPGGSKDARRERERG